MKKKSPSFRQTLGRHLGISMAYCISFSILIALLLDLYLIHHYTPWTFVAGIGIGLLLGILIHRYARSRNEQDPPEFR